MTQRTARLIWAALLATPLLFGAVAFAFARVPRSPAIVAPVFWLAAAASALNVGLSRVLPARLGAPATSDREALAFTRHLVACALCDAAAMAPLVAFMVTRDERLLVLFALDLLALALLYPTAARWARLAAEPAVGPAGRGVR